VEQAIPGVSSSRGEVIGQVREAAKVADAAFGMTARPSCLTERRSPRQSWHESNEAASARDGAWRQRLVFSRQDSFLSIKLILLPFPHLVSRGLTDRRGLVVARSSEDTAARLLARRSGDDESANGRHEYRSTCGSRGGGVVVCIRG